MKLERLTDWHDPRFMEMWKLYEKSFPEYETRYEQDEKRAMENPEYCFDLIYVQSELQGFVMYWDAPNFLYVEYIAMLPTVRGKGYGMQVLECLQHKGKQILLEIDPPCDEISVRRKGFYERAGFKENDFEYIHIPYKNGEEGHPLVIMTWPKRMTRDGFKEFEHYMKDVVMQYSENPERR